MSKDNLTYLEIKDWLVNGDITQECLITESKDFGTKKRTYILDSYKNILIFNEKPKILEDKEYKELGRVGFIQRGVKRRLDRGYEEEIVDDEQWYPFLPDFTWKIVKIKDIDLMVMLDLLEYGDVKRYAN